MERQELKRSQTPNSQENRATIQNIDYKAKNKLYGVLKINDNCRTIFQYNTDTLQQT